MKYVFKKILLVIVLLVIILFGSIVYAINKMISPEFIEKQINKLLVSSGHNFSIQRPINLKKFTNLVVRLKDINVTLKNKENIKIKNAIISLEWKALLFEQKIILNKIILTKIKASLLNNHYYNIENINANVNFDPIKIKMDQLFNSKDNIASILLDANLKVENILYNQYSINQLNAQILMQDGIADIISDISAYESNIQSNVKINLVADHVPLYKVNASIDDLNTQELLKIIIPTSKVSLYGRSYIQTSINFKGINLQQIISSLDGKFDLELKDSGLVGINLLKRIDNPMQIINWITNLNEQRTEFDLFKSSHNLKSGIIVSDDLIINAGSLSIHGIGSIDLSQKFINYRLHPALLLLEDPNKNTYGRDALYVPFILSGQFNNITFLPDVNNIISNIINSTKKEIQKYIDKDAIIIRFKILKNNLF